MSQKVKCPACQYDALPAGNGLHKCQNPLICGGLFDAKEIASGRIEGGTHGHRPDQRLIAQESGDVNNGYAIKSRRKLKGGL